MASTWSAKWRARTSAALHPYRLTSDVRITIFARLFAIGTISHVLEFLLEQARLGSITEYMERWSRLVPAVRWSSRTGLALFLAVTALSVLILVLPYSRELLCLLAGFFFLSEIASPGRISSHCSMMTGGLLIIVMLGVGEWSELWLRGDRPNAPSKEWYAWTLIGLRWICALTYFFAFFYKLNPGWFSPDARGPDFLIRPLEPILSLLGITEIGSRVLGPIAVYGTLLIELLLPVLFWMRRTRLIGCLVGLALSIGMVGQGVGDFPMLIVAFYPAFLTLTETRDLVGRCARLSVGKIVATLFFASVWFLQRTPKDNWMYARQEDPWILRIYNLLALLSFVFLIYVAVTIVQWLWETRLRDAALVAEQSRVERWDRAKSMSVAVVSLVVFGFVLNNLAGFFALPSAGPMYMFSRINADLSNHYIMPRIPITHAFDFVMVRKFETSEKQSPAAHEFRWLERSLLLNQPPSEMNLNELRYQMHRVCDASPKPKVELRLITRSGESLHYDDVCETPAMLWYIPLPIVSACDPRCNGLITSRIRREFHRQEIEKQAESGPE